MKISHYLSAALSGFIVFGPLSFLWHVVLFRKYYYNPRTSVKSPDDLNVLFLIISLAFLVLGMTYFILKVLANGRRLKRGAAAGALFASMVINFHSLLLMGLYPGFDPLYVYMLDAFWAIVIGGLAGLAVVATATKLNSMKTLGN